MLTFDLFTSKVKFASPFVWAIYIYIESIEVTCRSTAVKIVLIGNLRRPSGLYLLYFPTSVLFTCIKSWFIRNHLANFHQISHWSFCWNVIDSLFKWSCSIDCQAHIFFFKTKNCSNDISLVGMIGLEKCCITSTCLQWLCHSGERTVAHGPLVSICTCLVLSVFSSCWCLGRAVVYDCGTPWTFFYLTFFVIYGEF